MGYYCLGKNQAYWDIKFKIFWVPKPILTAKSQNLVNTSEAQKPTWAKFLEFGFFYPKRQGYIDITRKKNQLGVTSSSYVNLIRKLLIKSHLFAQKQGKSEILLFWGNSISIAASCILSVFSGFILFQRMV